MNTASRHTHMDPVVWSFSHSAESFLASSEGYMVHALLTVEDPWTPAPFPISSLLCTERIQTLLHPEGYPLFRISSSLKERTAFPVGVSGKMFGIFSELDTSFTDEEDMVSKGETMFLRQKDSYQTAKIKARCPALGFVVSHHLPKTCPNGE